jgi:hypothetical protein
VPHSRHSLGLQTRSLLRMNTANQSASLDGESPVLLTFSAHGLAASEPGR